MRIASRILLAVVWLGSSASLCFGQQTVSGAPQAAQVLQGALTATTGTIAITDVILTGTARRIAGSDDETGTATLKAMADSSRLDLVLPSGNCSEVRAKDTTGAQPTGAWTAADGVIHAMPYHNLLTEPAWFSPSFAISRGLAAAGYVAADIGHETRENVAVEHLTVAQDFSSLPADASASLQHLSQVDLYLDAATLLPVAMTFNIHPDNNQLVDILIEIRYSDYRAVNGIQVPFHVQKFLNNSLVLDLQFQTVTFNSGLSASSFSL